MNRYSHEINIHSKGQELKFYAAEYHVDLIGGLDIKTNEFYISLIDSNGSEIHLSDFTFPVQSLYGWRKAKRKYSVKIPREGVYLIKFNNPSNLVVKRSNVAVFPFSLFSKRVPTEEITVVFYRKV